MFLRNVIAVLLGAMLQVSMLGVGLASSAPAEKDCAPKHCCCSDLPACPCVKSGNSEKPAPPALPANQEQLTPVIVPTDPEIPGFVKPSLTARKPQTVLRGDDFHGYCGVALRVSFCRYTI